MNSRVTLLLAAVAGLVSCTTGTAGLEAAASRATTSTTVVQLTSPAPYQPVPGEPVPELKQLAADVLQDIGTYELGAAGAASLRLRGRGSPAVMEASAALLVPTAASAIDIVYPQLGGLTDTEASVMVVFRQRLLEGGQERSVTRTADVRLQLTPTGWSVSTIASLGGDPVAPGPQSPSAQAVLSSERIDLPDSARWDIQAGRLDDRVLQLLDRLDDQNTISVTVLSSGHPHNVFATDLVSNHSVGRGVDVWAVNGIPVVSQRGPTSPVRDLVEQLLEEGVTELGSPWDLDGPGRSRSFTNTVHQDHLHLAFQK